MHELCLKAIKRKGSPQIESGVDAGDGVRALQTHAVWNDAFIILYYRGRRGRGLHVLHAVIWDPTDTREYKCHYQKLLFFFDTCNALMILILVFSLCTNLSELSFGAWWTMKFQQVHHSECLIFRIAFKLSYSWTWPDPCLLERANNYLSKEVSEKCEINFICILYRIFKVYFEFLFCLLLYFSLSIFKYAYSLIEITVLAQVMKAVYQCTISECT